MRNGRKCVQFHGEGKGGHPRELEEFEAHISKQRSGSIAWSVPGIFSINKQPAFPCLPSQAGGDHMGCSFQQHCQPARGRPTGCKTSAQTVKIQNSSRGQVTALSLGQKRALGSLRNTQCIAAWSMILRLLEQKPHLSSWLYHT